MGGAGTQGEGSLGREGGGGGQDHVSLQAPSKKKAGQEHEEG